MNGKSYTASWRIVAAVMAALLGACSTGTEPNPNSRLSVSIVEPTAGVVNRTTPPDTRVRLRARVEGEGASDAQVRWLVGDEEACTTLSCMYAFPPGTHTLKVEARSGTNTATATATVENPPRSIAVVAVSFPDGATEFRSDEAVPCPTIGAEQPPARTEPTEESLSVNGTPAECMDGTLVPPTRQPTAPLSVAEQGNYTLSAEVCIAGTSVCDTGEVTFRVVTPPGQILFTGIRYDNSREFVLMDEDGSNRRVLMHATDRTWPNISPNGEKIAYTENSHGPCGWIATVANLNGSSAKKLHGASGGDCVPSGSAAPYWSPDGSLIAVLGGRQKNGTVASFILSSLGGSVERITGDGAGYPIFLPNGRDVVTIRFTAVNRFDGRNDVVKVNTATGATQLLLKDPKQDGERLSPGVYDVSPDGKWVTIHPFYKPQVILLATDGSGTMRPLTEQVQPLESGPRWATFTADGRYVCYADKNIPWGDFYRANTIVCLDLQGNSVWTVDLSDEYHRIETPRRVPLWGFK